MKKRLLLVFFAGLIAAFLLCRQFVVEPFHIPSKSMMPTLLEGDYIWVTRYAYGLRMPFSHKWIVQFGSPARGEVVVFDHPQTGQPMIKRVVGLPGDLIEIHENRLVINGEMPTQTLIEIKGAMSKDLCQAKLPDQQNVFAALLPIPFFRKHDNYRLAIEKGLGMPPHLVQHSTIMPKKSNLTLRIPEGSCFVLGDNRDRAMDSRDWGVLPLENLIGRAQSIWLSVNAEGLNCQGITGKKKTSHWFRWYRWGRRISLLYRPSSV